MGDNSDNCPNDYNPKSDWTDINGDPHVNEQPDFDLDGICDACDDDEDGDGYDSIESGGTDCNDSDGTVNPGAAEINFNGIDDDCFAGTPDIPTIYGTRTINDPEYTPTQCISVSIDVNVDENNVPNGLIINEFIPVGWSLQSATPANVNFDPLTGKINWLFSASGPLVEDRQITYDACVPAGDCGVRTIYGELLYNDPVNDYANTTIVVTGDTQTVCNQKTWDGGASDGLWSSPANWNPDGVPGTSNDVVIPDASGTIVFNTTASVKSITSGTGSTIQITGGILDIDEASTIEVISMTGGTLNANANVSIGTFDWSGGILTGAGSFDVTGTMDFAGAGDLEIDGCALTLSGANHTWMSNNILLRNGASLTVDTDATLEILGSNDSIEHDIGSATSFIINGTLRRTAASGTTTVSIDTTNNGTNGTIEIQSGTLDFNNNLNNASGATIQGTGSIDVADATITNDGSVAPGLSAGIL